MSSARSANGKPAARQPLSSIGATIRDAIRESGRSEPAHELLRTSPKPNCGAFSLEIRAWDIGTGDLDEIVEHFEVKSP